MADDPTTDTPDTDGDSSVIKDLRKQLKALTAERDELRAGARSRAFADAGITDAGRKAMNALYEGDLELDAIRSFAEDNGITVTAASDDAAATPDGDTQPAEVPETEQARRAAQQRMQQVNQLGNTPPPADPATELQQRIAKAADDGNQGEVMRLKSEQVQRLRAAGV